MNLNEKIINLLKEKNVAYDAIEHEEVKTSEEAAKVRNNPLHEGAKALIFLADNKPIQIIVPGDAKVDKEKVKAELKVEKLKMASIEEAEKISGAKVGGIPPFGNLFDPAIQVYVSSILLTNEFIEFNAGDRGKSIRMKAVAWKELVNPIIGDYEMAEKKSKKLSPPNPPSKTKVKAKNNNSIIIAVIFGLILLTAGIYQRITNPQKALDNKQEVSENKITESTESAQFKVEPAEPAPLPYKFPPPEISAKAYGIVDLTSGTKLYYKNADQVLHPASVTKIMTAVVAYENYDLDKPVVVPTKCVGLNASSIGLKANEVFTMEDLIYGLLVPSGADAACAIANIVDESEFVGQMNQKAKEIGMENTSFNNEIGLDTSEIQFSTINDLEKLTTYALKSSFFRKIVGTKEVTIKALNSTNSYKIKNTNDLLFTIPGTVGIKTGYTPTAGECLAYLYENKGQEFLIIMLGSNDRFGDTTKILNWAKEQVAL